MIFQYANELWVHSAQHMVHGVNDIRTWYRGAFGTFVG